MASGGFDDADGTGDQHYADVPPARAVAEGNDGAAPARAVDTSHDGDPDRPWRPSSTGGGDQAQDADTAVAHEADHGDDLDRPWRPSTAAESRPLSRQESGARAPVRPERAERIVLTDESSTSAWARPHDGAPRDAPDAPVPPEPAATEAAGSTGPPAAEAVDDRPPSAASDDPTASDDARPRIDEPSASGDVTGSRRTRRLAVVATMVAVAALFALAAAFLVRDRADRSEPAAVPAPSLPEGAQIAWTTGLDGVIEAAAAGEGLVAVVSSDGLTVLSAADGEVIWRRVNAADAGEIEQVAIIDGHVVATQQSDAGTTEVRSFDPATGTELWRTRGREGTYSITGAAGAPIIVGRERIDRSTELSVLDPADGTELGTPIRLSGVEAVGGDFAAAPTDRQVAVWSPEELDVVAGPVDEFNLRTVAELDGAVVALDLEGRIVAFDRDGRRSDELVLIGPADSSEGGAAIASVDFVGAASGVGVVSGEASLGFTVVDGRIETEWQRPGFAGEPTATSIGDLTVVVSRSDAGEISESILDIATGSVVTTVESAGPRERLSMLAANGYVIAPMIDAADRVVAAVGYDGEPLWSLPLSPEADYEVTADGIVVIEPTSGGADVSFAR